MTSPLKTQTPLEKTWLSKYVDFIILAWVITAVSLLASIFIFGCTTVTPNIVRDNVASFDGNEQNSGFLGWTNIDGMIVGMITPHALERYNALIAIYGKRFTPPIHKSEGVCTECVSNMILIQKEALTHFADMNLWRKQHAP